jgi:hypothetical protein
MENKLRYIEMLILQCLSDKKEKSFKDISEYIYGADGVFAVKSTEVYVHRLAKNGHQIQIDSKKNTAILK